LLIWCLAKIAPTTARNHPLLATEQVLLTLRFLRSGNFLEVIVDTFVSYHKSTVCRVVRRVTLVLATKVNDFVKFPETANQRDKLKPGLSRVRGFPCAIGCIKGTYRYIKIGAPSENEPDYANRVGYHSINV